MILLKWSNNNQGILALFSILVSIALFFLSKIFAAIAVVSFVLIFLCLYFFENNQNIYEVQKTARILFIDDKKCQIVTSLKRNNYQVREINDVTSPSSDQDVIWSNLIFVDYKDVGKELYAKKEGLGLIADLKKIYKNQKRYVIYSSVQDFDGLVGFPYIRKNASYDEFTSLIATEISKL